MKDTLPTKKQKKTRSLDCLKRDEEISFFVFVKKKGIFGDDTEEEGQR